MQAKSASQRTQNKRQREKTPVKLNFTIIIPKEKHFGHCISFFLVFDKNLYTFRLPLFAFMQCTPFHSCKIGFVQKCPCAIQHRMNEEGKTKKKMWNKPFKFLRKVFLSFSLFLFRFDGVFLSKVLPLYWMLDTYSLVFWIHFTSATICREKNMKIAIIIIIEKNGKVVHRNAQHLRGKPNYAQKKVEGKN